MNDHLQQRITAPGPKKILACDGGGILGLMSTEILARLELNLRTRLDQPNLVLADYFDFVCGTSTGAVIATCIAAGMPMDKLRDFYVGSGVTTYNNPAFLAFQMAARPRCRRSRRSSRNGARVVERQKESVSRRRLYAGGIPANWGTGPVMSNQGALSAA